MSAIIGRWTNTPNASANLAPPPGTSTVGERAPIDASIISNLRALQSQAEPNLLADLIDSFLDDSVKRIALMKGAAAAGNAGALTRAAHALKGASGIVGANRMAALCDTIEELALAGSVEGTTALITALEGEFERVRRALQAEKSSAAEKSS
ncbi:MAG: Hpt domain-containing protein [Acidobacteriota bacterium]